MEENYRYVCCTWLLSSVQFQFLVKVLGRLLLIVSRSTLYPLTKRIPILKCQLKFRSLECHLTPGRVSLEKYREALAQQSVRERNIQEYIIQVFGPCSYWFWSVTPAKDSCSSEGRNVLQATLHLKRCKMALVDNRIQNVEIHAVV